MDLLVTVPKLLWQEWIAEGDVPDTTWSGLESYFYLGSVRPNIAPGERVYISSFDRLRGYAPLVRLDYIQGRYALVRHGHAVACTIDQKIPGRQGFQYRFWSYDDEKAFSDWQTLDCQMTRTSVCPCGATFEARRHSSYGKTAWTTYCSMTCPARRTQIRQNGIVYSKRGWWSGRGETTQ
jgi:hypothetical protein